VKTTCNIIFSTEFFLSASIRPQYYSLELCLRDGCYILYLLCALQHRFSVSLCACFIVLLEMLIVSSLSVSVLQGYISRKFVGHLQGEVMGLLGAFRTLSMFLGPFLYNWMFSYFISDNAPIYLPGIVFYTVSVEFFLCLLFALIIFRIIPENMPYQLVNSIES